MKKWTVLCLLGALFLSLALFSGCVNTITVSPSETYVFVGEEASFTARKGDRDYTQAAWRLEGDDVGYLRSDSGSTVTVKTDAAGQTTVRAYNSLSSDGKPEDTAILIVKQKPASIEILPSNASMKEGDTKQFTATVRDEAGMVITGLSPNWVVTTTSGNGIGTVSPPNGTAVTFTAANYGTGRLKAVLDATSPNAVPNSAATPSAVITSNEVLIEVTYDPVLTTVEVSPSTWSIQEEATKAFTATGYDQKGNVMPDFSPIWSVTTSSGDGIGTVSPGSGQSTTFTAVSAGTGRLTATQGAKSDYADITVTYTPVLTRMTISPTTKTLTHGDSQLFSVIGYDQKGKAITCNPSWSLTGGILGKGTFTPSSGASSTLTAGDPGATPLSGKFRAQQGDVFVEADVTIQRQASQLASIEVPTDCQTMKRSETITAIAKDQYGDPFMADKWEWIYIDGNTPNSQIDFSSLQGSNSSCRLEIKSTVPEEYEIKLQVKAFKEGDWKSADITIVVLKSTVELINITLSSTSVVVDSSVFCSATGIDQYGYEVDVNPTWGIIGSPSGSFSPLSGPSASFTAVKVGDGSGDIIATDIISGSAPISVVHLTGVSQYYLPMSQVGGILPTAPLNCFNPAPQGAMITDTSCSFSGSDDSYIVYLATQEAGQIIRKKVWPPPSIIILASPSIYIDPFTGLTANRAFFLEFQDNLQGLPHYSQFIYQCSLLVYWRKG